MLNLSLFSILKKACIFLVLLTPPLLASNSNITLKKDEGIIYRDAFGNTGNNTTQASDPDNIKHTIGKSAIIYFNPLHNIDALTSASIIYNDKQQEKQALSFYIAEQLAHNINHSKLFYLQKSTNYPQEHNELINTSVKEHNDKSNIDIKIEPTLNLNSFSTIIIVFPLWWDDMPRALYSLFEKEDFSGKTIVPICLYNSNFNPNIVKNIQTLEPNAQVQDAIAIKDMTNLDKLDILQHKINLSPKRH